MQVGEVWASMGLDRKPYERELDRLEGYTQQRATKLGGVFKGALSVALGVGLFETAKRGFKAITSTAISYNALLEQSTIGFTTMLGSAERAAVFLDNLADFAAKTPFEFPDLLEASKRMLAYGFEAERVLPLMEAVGNATAGLGMGADGINRIILAMGQMRAKGKLSGEEMRQLTETGIPAWEILADAMGKTTAEVMAMQQKGLIPADKAITMLVDGMNKRFPDMMKNMENTWEGVTSTIKDVWQMTIGAITQDLFKGLVSWLQKVRDFATKFYDTFTKFGLKQAIMESFGPEIAVLVSLLTAVMHGFIIVIRAVIGFLKQYGTQIKFVVVTLGTYLTITKMLVLAKKALATITAIERGQLAANIPILNTLSKAMGIYRVQMALAAQQGVVLTGVMARLRVAIFSLWSALGPIGWLILAISAAAGVGIHMWGNYSKSVYDSATAQEELGAQSQQMADNSASSVDSLNDQADALKKAGKAAAKNLQPFDEINQLQKEAVSGGEGLGEGLALGDISAGEVSMPSFDVGAGLTGDLEQAKPTLAGFWDYLKQGAVNAWEKVKSTALLAWEAIKAKWAEADPWFKAIALVVGAVLVGAFIKLGVAAIINGAKVVASFIAQGVAAVAQGAVMVGQLALMVAKWAWAGVQSLLHAAKMAAAWVIALGPVGWITAAVIALAVLIIANWDLVKEKTLEIWGKISTQLVDTWDKIKDKAKSIWDSILNYFKTNWENTKKTVSDVWTAVATFFKNTWDSLKQLATTVWNAIKLAIETPIQGAKNTLTSVMFAIKSNITSAWQSVRSSISSMAGAIKNALIQPFNTAKSTISNIISQARNWGRNLLNNFISGVKSKFSDLKSTLKGAASTVKDFLGFSSPTKEGPGRTADEWAPNFIKMYAQGILQNSGIIKNAVGSVAQQLAGVATLPANSSQAVGTPATSAGVGDIYVYIGNEQIDAYIYKSQDRRSIRSNGRG